MANTGSNRIVLPEIPDRSGWPWTELSSQPALDQKLPKLSVITFSYNHASSLEATIRSVLLQSYPNLECIIVDGGSTDGSLAIIKKYQQWVSCVSSTKDPTSGLIDAIQSAQGDILSWLNAGDLYAPGALHIAAKRLAGRSLGLLVGSTTYTYGPDTLEGEIAIRWPSWEKMVYETAVFPQASVFWTHDLWNTAVEGLDAYPGLALDYYLWLQMFHHASTFIPEAIVLSYTRTPSQWDEAQRANAALDASKQRGELPLGWLIRLWLHRIRLALHKRRWDMLKGSTFHAAATRLVLSPHRQHPRDKLR